MPFVCGLLPHEFEQLLSDRGHEPYRARQVLRWVYQRGARGFADMSDLPQALRDELGRQAAVHPLTAVARRPARDGGVKLVLRLPDGAHIETVIMPYPRRRTACISSQVGCAYGCAFCATGGMGFERDLTAAEIVGQLLLARADDDERRLSNVVFMGMGEPLANYDALVKAVRIILDPACLGFGARHVAISTCGLPPEMRRLAREGLGVHLAVSLNAPDDDLRSRLMPVNRRHPLASVVAAARDFAAHTGRKVAFEYCLLAGVNDAPAQAAALAQRLRGLPCMVNLIPYNQARGAFARPAPAVMRAFRAELERRGVEVAVRRSFGEEVAAACGQLAAGRPNCGDSRLNCD